MNNGKVRIYELSKELNLENKDILAVCEQLNIAVKSHSSTISESEAERIRAHAEKYVASHSSASTNSTSASQEARINRPAKSIQKPAKKQEILEIRSKKSAPSSNSQQSSGKIISKPVPKLRAPNRPAASANDRMETASVEKVGADAGQKISSSEMSLSQTESAAASWKEDRASAAGRQPVESDSERNAEGGSPIPQKPALIGPPVKQPHPPSPWESKEASGAATTSGTNQSNWESDRQSKIDRNQKSSKTDNTQTTSRHSEKSSKPGTASRTMGAARPVLKPKPGSADARIAQPTKQPSTRKEREVSTGLNQAVGKTEEKFANRTVTPQGLTKRQEAVSEGAPPSKTKPVPELRRPRPIRPHPASTPVLESQETLPDLDDSEEQLESTIESSEVELKKRPILPRQAKQRKKRDKQEEEDDKTSQKSVKAGGKVKRRPQFVVDEDEDVLDEELDNLLVPVEVSLSLVRPAKPKSVSKPPPAKTTPALKRSPVGAREGDQTHRGRRDRSEPDTRKRPEQIELVGGLTVQELANLLVVPETEIVKRLFSKGIAATVTQTLDLPTTTLVAEELGVRVEMAPEESEARKVTEMLDAEDLENLQRRPPVVTIMGHVDHGKTTLLDSIRKTKVAQGEAGGITQHIGAYHVDVEHADRMEQIVFLDTPGHEAFTAMRARGARVTDIAILVVAADDGVRPQTIEAISHAKAAEVPIVVAINKIDKEGVQPERVKQELMEYGLVPEEWGGEAIMTPVSAITGENLDTLLEMILLVAEIEELSANPERQAKGTVIEAHLDKAKGPVATLLVQNGTLRVGNLLVAGAAFGKVRAMVDDRGQRVRQAEPSFAVEVLGLSEVPSAGDEFEVYKDEKEAKEIVSQRLEKQREFRQQQAMASRRVTLANLSARAQEGELKELNLVLKADVQGSVEAILGSLKQLPQNEVQIRVLLAAPGEVTETDVYLAAASDAVIIGFNTTLASGARAAADQAGVDVREYDVIYSLLDDIQGAMEGLLDPELVAEELGKVEVRAVFPVGKGAVAGCYVLSGKAIRNCNVRVLRRDNLIYEGVLDSLKRMKDDVKEVNAGFECGIGVDKFSSWAEGDLIETYRMVTKRRTLSPN